ncbi:DUF2062 domain-containing protein [Metallumcola ferriviriculae]|uniref:DUF2062 domain-containing protein n=1 Tax=Metallumcola ferriviriculae TaxID=3039180 RepID=A0AAU0UJA7_9FIRM|nr:DUF2062 domain-containing protein [Desulfitibacteraceae bacterium MK1]
MKTFIKNATIWSFVVDMKLPFSYLKKLKKASNQPYAVAVGMAIGIFWNFIPSLGVGVVLSGVTAKLMRSSSIMAVSTNISTAIFIPFFYTLNYLTGTMVIGANPTNTEVQSQLEHSLGQSLGNMETVIDQPASFFSWFQVKSISLDFIVGSLINATVAALITTAIIWFVLKSIKRTKRTKKKQPVRMSLH